MIGSMELPMDGYELLPQEGVSPRDWIQVPCTVMVPSSRTLVVDGLAEDTILLSVKGMKKDGIKTFLNDDNSIQRDDCLLIERDGKRFVVPFTNTKAYQVQVSDGTEKAAIAHSAQVTTKRSPHVPSYFHNATGHIL